MTLLLTSLEQLYVGQNYSSHDGGHELSIHFAPHLSSSGGFCPIFIISVLFVVSVYISVLFQPSFHTHIHLYY